MKFKSSSYKIVKEKRFRMFMLSLLIAVIAWSIINLSKEYTKTVRVVLQLVNIPKETLVKNEKTVLEIEVKGSGFSLLNNKLDGLVYEVNMNSFPEYWMWSNNESQFKSIISEQLKIKSVIPNRVVFDKVKLFKKKVKVLPNINVDTETGFGVSAMKIAPKEVTIYGEETIIKEIDSVVTETITLKNVKDSISGELRLKNNFKLKYSTNSIKYSYKVERFTQGEFTVPILVKNAPKDKEITIFPKHVTIQFQSPISKYSSIKSNQFQVYVDANEMVGGKLLKIKLANTPSSTTNVRVLKKSVTYLLLNK
ncbi:CdaR family protein [Pseudofulvibacter geojedonensis]|uniref:CdaR family protein n=1 Tax=Pseudofulvibacter geojedonensis TaxID=1123758 RepID=A0ABW3HZT9_9FLAO